MSYGNDLKRAERLAQMALDHMGQHKVPPEPPNYAVWYGYANGDDRELCTELNALIGAGQNFSPEKNAEIYDKFFGVEADSRAVKEASERIETAVSHIMKMLGAAEQEATRYGETLETFSGQLEQPLKIEVLRGIVDGLAAETKQMIERQRELDRALVRSTKEISQLRLNLQDVRREALTDPLTGIANRKQFDARLKEMAEEAEQEQTPLSVLLADIDFFKNFNDRFGHAVGDKVLRLVALTMTDSIKGRDLAARLGGEEFAVVLPNTSLQDAVTVGNQIRLAVGTRKIVVRSTGENLGSVELSLGAAEYQPGEALSALVERADRALYTAKRNGRNQVVASGASSHGLAKSA